MNLQQLLLESLVSILLTALLTYSWASWRRWTALRRNMVMLAGLLIATAVLIAVNSVRHLGPLGTFGILVIVGAMVKYVLSWRGMGIADLLTRVASEGRRTAVAAAILSVIATGAIGAVVRGPGERPPPVDAAPSASGRCPSLGGAFVETTINRRFVEFLNARREELDLRPVALDPALTRVAAWEAAENAMEMALSRRGGSSTREQDERARACGYPPDAIRGSVSLSAGEDMKWLRFLRNATIGLHADTRVIGLALARSPTYAAVTLLSGGANTAGTVSNASPVAVDDVMRTRGTQPAVGAPLANDRDPDSDPLSLRIIRPPRGGQLKLTQDGRVIYRPRRGFRGIDLVEYEAVDLVGATSTAQLQIRVLPPR